MAKILKVKFPQNCIGCELCVFEAQRQLNKIGLNDAPIRVFKNKPRGEFLTKLEYTIELDPSIDDLDIEEIAKICPKAVFEIIETDNPLEEKLLE